MLAEKQALIRQLQTQLRNEEMSLVLLKKIRQSQVLAEQAKEAAAKVSIQPAITSGVSGKGQSHTNRGTPPPQVKGASNRPSSNAVGGSNGRPGAGQNMKNVLTPDLSLLKPVSVVRKLLLFIFQPIIFQ